MPTELSRQWFVPGEGIDRHVISADIQRYLGNDATVRPGVGTNENQGVQGFWIKAYRNLTNAMIEDLKADSARWRQEQRQTGTRGSQSPYYKSDASGMKIPDPFPDTYERSVTYRNSGAGRTPQNRRDTESPSLESPYGVQPASRIPPDTRMQIDQPGPQSARPYSQDRPGYAPASQPYGDNRAAFTNDGRPNYPMENAMQPGYNRPQGTQSYQDPRYVTNYPPGNDNVQSPGFRPPTGFYVPASAPYDPNSSMATSRPDNSQYGNGPYQPPPPGRDPRDQRYQQPEYNPDGRYAYPSPAVTTIGVNNSRDPVTSPPQSTPYGQGPPARGYDQYGNQRSQYR